MPPSRLVSSLAFPALLPALLLAQRPFAPQSAPAPQVLGTQFAGTHWLASTDGGVYFDLSVQGPLRIVQLDVNLWSPAGTTGAIDVWLRPETWRDHVVGTGGGTSAGDWMLAGTGAVTAAGADQPSPCVLQGAIALPPGQYGVALRHRGVVPFYSFAFGSRSFANADLRVTCGAAAVTFLDSAPFEVRVFNGTIHYLPGGGPYAFASCASFGAGCHREASSWYEDFAAGTFDLAQQRLLLTPNGGGYDVALAGGGMPALTPAAVDLNLPQNGSAGVALPAPLSFPGGATSQLLVQTDGRVLLTDRGLLGNPGAVAPQTAALLTGVPSLAVAWMQPAANGTRAVFCDVDRTTGTTTVWWVDPQSPTTPAVPGSAFALRIHGDDSIELAYGSVANGTGDCIVGFAGGAGARDPGGRDVSRDAPFSTHRDDAGLQLVATGRPVAGSAFAVRMTDLPAQHGAAALLLGGAALAPALDLGSLGAAGCALHVDPQGATWLALGAATPLPIAVPSHAALLGTQWFAQAIAAAPARNALGAVTSNALALGVGTH